MKNKLLFELGLEEVPADMIEPALAQMQDSCEGSLREAVVSFDSIRTYSSPRRLTLLVSGLPERQPDREEMTLGPPRDVAYDSENRPTKALEGFARKMEVSVQDLEEVKSDRGVYLGCRKTVPGEELEQILQQVFPVVMTSLSWPKNMYWRESRFRFIRPVRWLVALLNDRIIPFQFEGIQAGNYTQGHRFLGAKDVVVPNVDKYLATLRANFVLADPEERNGKITRELAEKTPSGMQLLPDPKLLQMVSHLNEYPSVIQGQFGQEFLELPQEILVTVMRYHQKYFAITDDASSLRPYFLTVVNTEGDPQGEIRRGHEKVLEARLKDAAFFWEADRARKLEERLDDLDRIVFQEKLGSYRAKTERVEQLCGSMSEDVNLKTAARLCKTDLATEMVGELAELQGVMGGLYAREEGYPEEVWRAIYEHYRPVSLEDDSPGSHLGALLSIADRLDTIVGCFSVGIVPKGSSDPFALRRQAQGAIKVLFDHRMDYSPAGLVELAMRNLGSDQGVPDVSKAVEEFLLGRLRHIFQEKGIAYDVLNAVLSVELQGVHDAFERAQALSQIRDEEDFQALAGAYKRTKNILSDQTVGIKQVDEQALEELEEKNLYRAYAELKPKVNRSVESNNYMEALRLIASLRSVVDHFFDKVLVMTDDERLRENRLCLLRDISRLFLEIADISEIVQTGVPSQSS